ncbi:MAG: NADH-quinone oxidoreductase subunit G [Rhodospirillaceae bacterium]|nr:MAG: NADH-quinone oxidoreductase subunit G [Rhodospirillaceae bacterium]
MPKLTIDGVEIEVEAGTTVLQACERLGIEIPRFCYHDRLSIAGNCRMCLVEVSPGPPKAQASCALPVADGMTVKTDSPMVRKARRGVMELLLINHPLDCPICDQGGECDLQDQAMAYGGDKSRYREEKRAVADKYLGPLIKTCMTRCIQCTRCVRFMTEVAGVPELGAVFRGEHMEITTYIGQALDSELSGNLVDLCPVGALTSRPYAFMARPWELHKTESIDVLDALGCAIRVDSRGGQVLRVLPRLHEEVNEEWISDKTRHACDGLRVGRLDTPYVRRGGTLRPASWAEAFAAVAEKLKTVKPEKIAVIAGDLADCEAMMALKDLTDDLKVVHRDCRQDGAFLDPNVPAAYRFNTTIAGIEMADALLLVGTNPRREAAVLNARIRKRWVTGALKVAAIGEKVNLTYPVAWLGTGPQTLKAIAEGRHPFGSVLKGAQRPMLILGQGALARSDGAAILGLSRVLAETSGMVREDWNGFNVLHTAAARVGGLMLGFVPGEGGRDGRAILDGAGKGEIGFVYLLNADEIDTGALGKAFVVYQGHHGDAGAKRADVILPGAAYTEKNALYVNTEGRVQSTQRAVFPPGEAREDWKIVRALSETLGRPLPYDSLEGVRARLVAVDPAFAAIAQGPAVAAWGIFGDPAVAIDAAPFAASITNFYGTDPISRASKTMAECVAEMNGRREHGGTGTYG